MSVGILGFGRLGSLLVRELVKEREVVVHDPKPLTTEIQAAGATPVSFERACAQDVVVLCVPISALADVVRQSVRHITPGALLVDVCSVMEYPVRILMETLPPSVEILATHPAFGPDSAAQSLSGQKIILHPVRVHAERYERVKKYLSNKGLCLIEVTPAEHDRQMAQSLVLTHFIGRGLIASGAQPQNIDTEGYKRLMHILQTVKNDTWQLFEDMNRYNSYASGVRDRFLQSLRDIDAQVKK